MRIIFILACTMSLSVIEAAPVPNAPVPKADIEKLIGPYDGAELSRDINILWLYGPEDHKGGEHDYIRVMELYVPMLKTIPRVSVDTAYQFPSEAQFEHADLIIQFLHMPDVTDEQLARYQQFVDEGGRVVSIHESCIMRPVERAELYAGCIGCSWKGNKSSKWGKFGSEHRLFLDTEHPVFEGLPKQIELNDESYWNLLARDNVQTIGAVGPKTGTNATSFSEVLNVDGVRNHAFWAYTSGSGKVFGTTTGHYTYTYFDPMYRILLFRGIAWVLDEDPASFMPLIFRGNTDDNGFVGTKYDKMKYENRAREQTADEKARMEMEAGKQLGRDQKFSAGLKFLEAVISDEAMLHDNIRAEGMYWAGFFNERLDERQEAIRHYHNLHDDFPHSKWAKFARGRLAKEHLLGLPPEAPKREIPLPPGVRR